MGRGIAELARENPRRSVPLLGDSPDHDLWFGESVEVTARRSVEP
jgi:hypothetical protein